MYTYMYVYIHKIFTMSATWPAYLVLSILIVLVHVIDDGRFNGGAFCYAVFLRILCFLPLKYKYAFCAENGLRRSLPFVNVRGSAIAVIGSS
jgi:hypothetical protein